MTKALFPGTFDPITRGHVDLVKRAAALFDEVHVVILLNHEKKALFDVSQRRELIKESLHDIPNVIITVYSGLTVQYAKEHDLPVMIRGVRSIADYEYEMQVASVNSLLEPSVETLFFVSKPEYACVSSSNAKAVAIQHGDVTPFVEDHVAKALNSMYNNEKDCL